MESHLNFMFKKSMVCVFHKHEPHTDLSKHYQDAFRSVSRLFSVSKYKLIRCNVPEGKELDATSFYWLDN